MCPAPLRAEPAGTGAGTDGGSRVVPAPGRCSRALDTRQGWHRAAAPGSDQLRFFLSGAGSFVPSRIPTHQGCRRRAWAATGQESPPTPCPAWASAPCSRLPCEQRGTQHGIPPPGRLPAQSSWLAGDEPGPTRAGRPLLAPARRAASSSPLPPPPATAAITGKGRNDFGAVQVIPHLSNKLPNEN